MLKRRMAVLAAILLTFVGHYSAAHYGFCETRRLDPFRTKLEAYDRATWLRNIEVNCNSTNVVPRASHTDLLAGMPEELKEELRLDIAARRARRWGNKRNLDFVFNLLDRGDKVFAGAPNAEGEAAYHRYFAHESIYFSPAYSADLVLEVARAVHAAVPAGSDVGLGGSFVNARADVKRDAWDVDLFGRNITAEGLQLVKAAIENVFLKRGLKPPVVDHHRIPPHEMSLLNLVHFEIHGGDGPLNLWVNPPMFTDSGGYIEPGEISYKFVLK